MGVKGVVHDRQLRTALAAAERDAAAKDRFIATVAHELRAPLMTIMLWEKVLRDHLDEPELRMRALDAIRDSAKTQSRVVGDLLDAARAMNGKLTIERAPLAVRDVLDAAIHAIRPAADLRGIAIDVTSAARLPRVRADAVRLRQVFDNLLGNALKFTPRGGMISVACRRDARRVVIDVSDNGQGISADLLPHLFIPFSQHAERGAQGGLGLGLAICRQLITLHGGTLTAHSDGPGRGATFTITLPVDRARAAR